ncbi:hypothetical protein DM2_3177 [Halorubrum sp. DM2]|uniref:hypothetical protein n=1 Tax=Halorubrum sp. DM2 TaxID=2527867 RepID=UPI0024B782B5|nr:hypothetical protein [Halorubrum sp. DM2]VTT87139.1 hypothetical protein DM2_3177 [Halorubrum sp. DM2]
MSDDTRDETEEPDATRDEESQRAGDRGGDDAGHDGDGGPPGVETREGPPTDDPSRNYRPIDLEETGKGALPRNHPRWRTVRAGRRRGDRRKEGPRREDRRRAAPPGATSRTPSGSKTGWSGRSGRLTRRGATPSPPRCSPISPSTTAW